MARRHRHGIVPRKIMSPRSKQSRKIYNKEPARDKRCMVPWFSMSEWDCVYKQIYSGDTDSQKIGLERLLVWKARCPDLPAGVLCTLDLIQVCLKDREMSPLLVSGKLSPQEGLELRLMYSTVIMRWLNHISSLTQDVGTETLYQVAEKLHIPLWVVSIRHSSAHDNRLPSLDLLRTATHFCLDWLHEHYWKGEAQHTKDVIVIEKATEIRSELKLLLELWLALNLYKKAGCEKIRDISDPEIWKNLAMVKPTKLKDETVSGDMEVESDTPGETGKNENSDVEIIPDSDIEIVHDEEEQDTEDLDETSDCTIQSALDSVVNIIRKFIKHNVQDINFDRIFVKLLLEKDLLLPSYDIFQSLINDSDASRLEKQLMPLAIVKMWQPIIKILPASCITYLLEELITITGSKTEPVHRQNVSSAWVKELLLAIQKAQKMNHLENQLNTEEELKRGDDPRVRRKRVMTTTLLKRIEKGHKRFEHTLTLAGNEVPANRVMLELLKLALLQPSKGTLSFLSVLLELLDDPLPPEIAHNVTRLVEIYMNNTDTVSSSAEGNTTVYTVESLKAIMSSEQKSNGDAADLLSSAIDGEDCTPQDVEQRETTHWTKADGNLQWSTFPLGVLPWQRNLPFVRCDLPKSEWKPVVEPDTSSMVTAYLPGLFHEEIDWEAIKEKRRLRKNRAKSRNWSSNLVEKAFKVVKAMDEDEDDENSAAEEMDVVTNNINGNEEEGFSGMGQLFDSEVGNDTNQETVENGL